MTDFLILSVSKRLDISGCPSVIFLSNHISHFIKVSLFNLTTFFLLQKCVNIIITTNKNRRFTELHSVLNCKTHKTQIRNTFGKPIILISIRVLTERTHKSTGNHNILENFLFRAKHVNPCCTLILICRDSCDFGSVCCIICTSFITFHLV